LDLIASSVSLPWSHKRHFCQADKPSVEFALQLTPVQDDVDYDQPSPRRPNCVIEAESDGTATSWVVRNSAGQILRKFQDTNGDNKVDRWCYFKNGIETYRDIDADFNGKADQYRWLGTSGTRWGVDETKMAASMPGKSFLPRKFRRKSSQPFAIATASDSPGS
jgi:hypothetical protein